MTNFVIGATFNATEAVKQLNNFIATVQAKAQEASVSITSALAGGAGAGSTLPIGKLSKDLESVQKMSRNVARDAAKDAKAATEGNLGAIGASTQQIKDYGEAIGLAAGKWNSMAGALEKYATYHKTTLGVITEQINAYAQSIQRTAQGMGVTAKDLVGAMRNVTKAASEQDKANNRNSGLTAEQRKALKEQEETQQRINAATEQGVFALNQRLVKLRQEAAEADVVLQKQRAILQLQQARARGLETLAGRIAADPTIGAAEREGRLATLQERRLRTIERMLRSEGLIEDTKDRQRRLTQDITKIQGSAAKQTLIAASNLATVIKRVALWSFGMSIIFGTIQSINQAFRDSITLQDKLIQIAKIKPENFDVAPLKKGAVETATKYGIELKEIAETMRVFAQQGKGTEEILTLIDVAAKGVVATNLTMNNSVQLLTATMNIFGKSIDEVEIVLDKIQKVQANFAVTAEDLSDAMRLLGPIVRTLGSDMDFLLGSVTAVAEATRQTGKFVGNALKTIFARLPKKDSLFLLNSLGVTLYDMAGNVRPLNDVLGELAGKWDTLTGAAKLNLATTLGGVRRYNVFITLMDNWNRVIAASETSMSALGAAQEAVNKEQLSLQRRLNITREQFRRVGLEVTEGLAPILVDLSEFLANTTKSWVIQGIAITAAAAGLIKLARSINNIRTIGLITEAARVSMGSFALGVAGATKNMASMVKAGTTWTAVGKAGTLAWRGGLTVMREFIATTAAALLPMALLVGATYAVIKVYNSWKKSQKEARELQDDLAASAKRFNSIGIDFAKFNGLPSTFADTNQAISELLSGLDKMGIKSATATGAVLQLDNAMNLFVKGFSTQDTVKQIQNGVDVVQKFADRLSQTFADMANADGPSRTGEAVGQGFWKFFIQSFESDKRSADDIQKIFQNVLDDAAAGIKADDPAKRVIGALQSGFGRETDPFGVSRLTLNFDALAEATRRGGADLNKYGTITKIVDGLTEEYLNLIAKGIVLKERDQKLTKEQLKLHSTQVNLFDKIVRKAIEYNNIQEGANSTYSKQLEVLLQYRTALDTVINSEKGDIAAKQDIQQLLLNINDAYQDLRNKLDEIDNKARTSAAVSRILGLGYNEAADGADILKAKIEAYISTLNEAKLLEAQYARQDALASTQRLMTEGFKDVAEAAHTLEQSGVQEIVDQQTEANVKARDEAVKTGQRLAQLYQAWGKITGELGDLGDAIVDYVNKSKEAGIVTNDWGNELYRVQELFNKNAQTLREAARSGAFTANSFDLVGKAFANAKTEVGQFRNALASAQSDLLTNAAAIGGLKAQLSDLEHQKENLEIIKLVNPSDVGTAQKILDVEKRIREVKSQIVAADIESKGIQGAILQERLRLNQSEEKFHRLQQRILDNQKLFNANTAVALKLQNDLEGSQIRTTGELSRLSRGSLKSIELTNRLYDEQLSTIYQVGVQEAQNERDRRIASGQPYISQELALELSQKQQIAIYENELGRLTKLRQLREQALTDQYEVQEKKLQDIGNTIQEFYGQTGDLLADPIKRAIDLAGTLSYKIKLNTKLFDVQSQVTDQIYNTRLQTIEALRLEGKLSDERASQEVVIAGAERTRQAALIDLQRELAKIRLQYDDHIAQLEKSVSVYKDIKGAILNTVTDFDALVDDAHVFRNLFDEIGNIYFKRGIESVFDKVFAKGDDTVSKLLNDGYIDAKVKLLIEQGSLQNVIGAVSNVYSEEEARLSNLVTALETNLSALGPTVVQQMTDIGNSFYNQILGLLQAGQQVADESAKRIAAGNYTLDDSVKELRTTSENINIRANEVVTRSGDVVNIINQLMARLNAGQLADSQAAAALGDSADQSKGVSDTINSIFGKDSIPVTLIGVTPAAVASVAAALQSGGGIDKIASIQEQGNKDNRKDADEQQKKLDKLAKLNSGISLASLLVGSTIGTNAGRGLSSGAGTGQLLATLFGVESFKGIASLIGGGALLGGIFGFARDRKEKSAQEAEQRRLEEERRKRELEAARQRAAILDAAERTANNTDPLNPSTLFAPSGFRIPSYALRGGGLPGGQTNNFRITVPLGAEAGNVAAEISKYVDGNYNDESLRQSSNSDAYL